MQKIITLIKIAVITLFICSCSNSKMITGKVENIVGDTIYIPGYRFRVDKLLRGIGDTATFTRVVNRSKINCKRLKY